MSRSQIKIITYVRGHKISVVLTTKLHMPRRRENALCHYCKEPAIAQIFTTFQSMEYVNSKMPIIVGSDFFNKVYKKVKRILQNENYICNDSACIEMYDEEMKEIMRQEGLKLENKIKQPPE